MISVEKKLKKSGYKVLIPKTARIMQKKGDYNDNKHRTWLTNEKDYKIKKSLMDGHFKKILRSDAILVVNNEKKGIKGYIGGNVLMEITVAYMQKLRIFILNPIDSKSPFEEELKAIDCIFLNQDLSKMKFKK